MKFTRNAQMPLTLPQWVRAVHADGPNNFFAGPTLEKRREVRHYVAQNLSAGQVSFTRAHDVQCAARSMLKIRSAFDSARDAFRCEYSIYRSV
jgi:hypothetical protein